MFGRGHGLLYSVHAMRVVTSYPNPDLDGVACALAYADLLTRTGTEAQAVFVGTPDKEARAALEYWKLMPTFDQAVVDTARAVVLVDAASIRDFWDGFNPTKVVELIDHRQLHEAESFPHAQRQIELVGAAATLVAERFQAAGQEPEQAHAGLLAGAIVSGTVNLRTSNTTARDRAMLTWAAQRAGIGEEYYTLLRRARSHYAPGELYDSLVADAAIRRSPSGDISILQIEAEGAEGIMRARKEEVRRALAAVRAEMKPDYAFVNFVDLGTGTCAVFADHSKERALLARRLGVAFDAEGFERLPTLLLRKQIGPLL